MGLMDTEMEGVSFMLKLLASSPAQELLSMLRILALGICLAFSLPYLIPSFLRLANQCLPISHEDKRSESLNFQPSFEVACDPVR